MISTEANFIFGYSLLYAWQITALKISLQGYHEPWEPFEEVRAKRVTSYINERVWWSWILIRALANRLQNLNSLVKGDRFTQKSCQLD
jgi:hypothetical protein